VDKVGSLGILELTGYISREYLCSDLTMQIHGIRKAKGAYTRRAIYSHELCSSLNAFYEALESVLRKYGFDKFVEEICHAFYADGIGRPGLAPGVYFRMLLIGYMEGWGSEREIAWRCNDSLALRKFSGYALTARLPDHSTLSKTRKRLSVEVHMQVFEWVLQRLKKAGLLRGKTLGIDATTLEANAVMRSIVRRDTGQKYDVFWNRWRRRRGLRRRPTRIW